ncbi:hypothetical protein ScPMuIL_000152 [Solemya velum]
MDLFRKLFKPKRTTIIGMVHLRSLPGTPQCRHTMKEIVNIACREAAQYRTASLDGLIVENMHDVPYLHTEQVGPEVTAAMAVICSEVKKTFNQGPVGVQILAGANRQALAVAKAAGLDFIRAEGYVFSHVADEGLMNACAGQLLRYRKHIGAENVLVFTDIKKKHSAHSITSDVTISETAKAAELFLSDGVIITGTSTGVAADVEELSDVKSSVEIPVLIGSGVTADNMKSFMQADALIIGSHFKKDGNWKNDIDDNRLSGFMKKMKDFV